MPFAAQFGSVCPLCKAGFVDRGRVSTSLRLLVVFLNDISRISTFDGLHFSSVP